MYISHDVAGGSGLATVVRSAGDGARVTREDRACLGRVVDRARGVYRSKARGLFPCDLATGKFRPTPGASRGRGGATPAPSFPPTNFSLDHQSERGRGHNTDRSI